MDFLNSMKIISSGLSVQRKRMEVIASNLANIETTRTPEGGPYRRKDVVVSATPLNNPFSKILKTELGQHINEVSVAEIVEDQSEPRLVYNPDHPDANEEGYVAMPNVNLMSETVNMINASRAFEANISAANVAKAMAQRAIELGR